MCYSNRMHVRFGQSGVLALQAARALWRQPLPVLTATLGALMAALFPLLVAFPLGDSDRLVRDGALALYFSLGVYLAAAAASGSLDRDREAGWAALVLSKAVSRSRFYLARYGGVLLVLALFSLCLGLAALLSGRVGAAHDHGQSGAGLGIGLSILAAHAAAGLANYRCGRPYASMAFGLLAFALLAAAAVPAIGLSGGAARAALAAAAVRLAPALLLIGLALAVLAAVVMALSVRLPPAPVAAAGGLVFLLGLVRAPLVDRAAAAGNRAAASAAALLPDWHLFWAADALSGGGRIPWDYVGGVGLYAVLYTAGMVLIGLALYGGRDL